MSETTNSNACPCFGCRLVASESHARALSNERDALQRFKMYVHARLDGIGVPHDPDPEHNRQHGCRIEGRINWLASRLEGAEAACNQAQARFATLWTFLQWVRTRNWTLQQLDDKARDLNDEGPYEIGVNVAAELSTLRALTPLIDDVLRTEGDGTKAYPTADDVAPFYRALQALRLARNALLTPPAAAASNESEPK